MFSLLPSVFKFVLRLFLLLQFLCFLPSGKLGWELDYIGRVAVCTLRQRTRLFAAVPAACGQDAVQVGKFFVFQTGLPARNALVNFRSQSLQRA
jgi:hypothetical protein